MTAAIIIMLGVAGANLLSKENYKNTTKITKGDVVYGISLFAVLAIIFMSVVLFTH